MSSGRWPEGGEGSTGKEMAREGTSTEALQNMGFSQLRAIRRQHVSQSVALVSSTVSRK